MTVYGVGLVFAGFRILRQHDGGVLLAVLAFGMVALVWAVMAMLWLRSRIRAGRVRIIESSAILFEVVMTAELASAVRRAEAANGLPAPWIWAPCNVTVAVDAGGITFYGGAFRPVARGRLPASFVSSLHVAIAEFPTRTVTRHFPAMVISVRGAPTPLTVLPVRTTWTVPRKLPVERLRSLTYDVTASLGLPT